MMLLILSFLIASFSVFANDTFSPLFSDKKVNCSTSKIIKTLPNDYKKRIETINLVINQISNELKVDACLILSIVWVESTFKVSQRSFKGANGLMQVMPRTASAMRTKLDYKINMMITNNLKYNLTYNEIENLIIGTYYYKQLLKRFKGNIKKAVIAYNMGVSYVLNNGVSSNHNYLKKVISKHAIISSN